MKQRTIIFLSLIFNFAFGYETRLFQEIDFFSEKYQKYDVGYNLFDFSGNPALMKSAYQKNIDLYQFSGGKNINSYHRYYDSERTENLELNLNWVRQLGTKSLLATGVRYQHSYLINVERSLEKNYYDHYFGFTDTTNGDITYQGPRLFILYNRNINENLLWGLEINYGVERGLKDIYTECETIMRDMDASLGLGYFSDDKNTIIGLSARYFNRQAKYEAVKYYLDAVVKTWMGYHLYMPEVPRSTNRKNDDREGYDLGIQIEQKQLLGTNFGIRLSGNFGEHKNDIEVGSPSNTKARGYWQRQASQYFANLFYKSDKIEGHFYFIHLSRWDWAKPKTYEVLALENEVKEIRLGGILNLQMTEKITAMGGFEFVSENRSYDEYAANYKFSNTMNSSLLTLGGLFALNPITVFSVRGHYGISEPDFHWPDTDRFAIMGGKFGVSRQFVYVKLDIDLNYSLLKPNNSDKQNEVFGINITFQR